ncbi:MAG: TonB-dependent receptor [Candidatus Binatia bacterium]|nr:TonB-dependent receptor [Candidatus Binatia bacterium]
MDDCRQGNAPTTAIVALLALVVFSPPPSATAQTDPAGAPSSYLENIETPGDVGGTEAEVDAGPAEAQRGETGAPVPGVSPRQLARVEEIVVQARKRSEFLEDTPISVTALSAASLRESNIQRTDQLAELVPNLVFTEARTTNAARARIRGVGTTTGEVAFDPGVGTYVDGVYLPRGGKIIDVLDIEQVEVLRGPQGTLFGKNTVGGAISLTTVKPHEELEGFVFVRPGSRGQLRSRWMMNVPIALGWLKDKLFSRVAVATANNRGWVFNEAQDNYESNLNSVTFLGSLRFLPIDDLTIDVSGSWDRSMSHRRGRRCQYQQPGALTPLFPDLQAACEASEPFRVSTNFPNSDHQLSYGAWGTINYDIGDVGPLDSFSVKSITSWREQKTNKYTSEDIDTTEIFVTQLSTLPGQPGFQQFQQELQLNGTAWDDRIAFIGGFFGFWDKGGDVGGAGGGGVTETGTGFRSIGQTSIDNFTWALFTQATAKLTDFMSLTGGVRYTEDTKRNSIANQALTEEQLALIRANPALVPDLFAQEGTSIESGEETFTRWTPMGSISFFAPENWLDAAALDHLMTYFSYSQGFRGGGFNTVIDPLQEDLLSFEPETIENFEVGIKTIGWDQRVTFNLSLFYMNFDDIQVLQNVAFDNPDDPDTPIIRRITTNAAKARSKGLEAELQTVPIDGLQITGNIGVLDAKFTEFVDASGNDRSGNRFGEPKFTSFLAVQYSLPVTVGSTWLDGWLTPRLQWSYTGQRFFGALSNPSAFQRGYNKLDARLSYDFLDNSAQVALWGINLTNEEYLASAEDLVGVFGFSSQNYASPITFGGEMSYRF